MRNILVAFLIVILSLAVSASDIYQGGGTSGSTALTGDVAQNSSQYQISQNFNNALTPLPGVTRMAIGDERIIFDVKTSNGTNLEYGAISKSGFINQVSLTPYPDSTVRVTTSEATIDSISNSSDPYSTFRQAWGTTIRVEGLNFFSMVKLFLTDIVMQFYFVVTPAYSVPTTSINATSDEFGIDNNPIDCNPLTGGPGGTPVSWTPEDRGRFTNVTDNITILQQPNGTTCSPTAGAIDLLHWNETIFPGLVTGNASALIDDMARRMNTTSNGTSPTNIAKGIASYLADHNASNNFTVKIYYKARKEGTNVTGNVTTYYSIEFYNDLQYEYFAGENLIVDVAYDGGQYHSMKMIGLQRNTDANDEHLVAFADPASGGVVFGGLKENGQLDIYGKPNAKIVSFVAVSPKK